MEIHSQQRVSPWGSCFGFWRVPFETSTIERHNPTLTETLFSPFSLHRGTAPQEDQIASRPGDPPFSRATVVLFAGRWGGGGVCSAGVPSALGGGQWLLLPSSRVRLWSCPVGECLQNDAHPAACKLPCFLNSALLPPGEGPPHRGRVRTRRAVSLLCHAWDLGLLQPPIPPASAMLRYCPHSGNQMKRL